MILNVTLKNVCLIFSESPKMGEKGSVWPQVLGAFGGEIYGPGRFGGVTGFFVFSQ